MACAYLLSLEPSSPAIAHASDAASSRVDGVVANLPHELVGNSQPSDKPEVNATEDDVRQLIPESLQNVLELHTSRRMKPLPPLSKEAKQGVSIPSQRRWLYYWSLILARQAPPCVWPLSPPPDHLRPKALLTYIKLRMRELSGIKMKLVEAASSIVGLGKAGSEGGGKGLIWASLARYDDELLNVLEGCERCSREDSDMGKRTSDGVVDEESLRDVFRTGEWDSQKMVLPFARLSSVAISPDRQDNLEVGLYSLRRDPY
jgi:phosphatidylinositol-3,4,5-trisphosphate 3-phosphatase/dual-specificity protein phosphatase PTEN